jgi:lipid A 3-O-deacylase
MKRCCAFLILVFVTSYAFCGGLDNLAKPIKKDNYFRLKYDNDFFSATDRYYTQGIILDFIHPTAKRSPISYCLLKLSKTALNYYGLHLEQDVFTPKSIRYKDGEVYYGERPFTAIFFLSHSLSSINTLKNTLLYTQLDLGILGPYAKGEEEQKGIHKALDNIEPQGWQNQLSSAAIINYRASFQKAFSNKKHIALIGFSSARFGTLYTDAGLGLKSQLGFFNSWHNYLCGSNATTSPKKFTIYAYASAYAKLVAYNATLQGGLFNAGNIYALPSTSINRLVAELSLGITLSYKRLNLEYSKYYITPEFKHGVDHGWGRCLISLRF